MKNDHPRSSRQRYRTFVQDYKNRRLDDSTEADPDGKRPDDSTKAVEDGSPARWRWLRRGKRRDYLHEYLRWLKPHRYAVGVVFLLALLRAGLEMIEPLFMRFIIDRVLLNTALDVGSRLSRLQLAGAAFLAMVLRQMEYSSEGAGELLR